MKQKKEQPRAAGPSEGSRRTPEGNVQSGTRWTPGPWRACHNGKCSCRQVWSMPGDCPVFTAAPDAHVQIGMAHHDWGDSPDLVYGQIPIEEMQANAKLIAAAPELYKSLDEAQSVIGDMRRVLQAFQLMTSGRDDELSMNASTVEALLYAEDAHKQARAALAKARGEVTA